MALRCDVCGCQDYTADETRDWQAIHAGDPDVGEGRAVVVYCSECAARELHEEN